MEPSPFLKPLTLFLAFSGLIQGLLWTVLSVLGLLTHIGVLDIPLIPLTDKPTHNDIIANTIKAIYFSDADFQFSVYPKALALFMCFYCAISIFWIGFSCLIIYFARCSEWIALRRSLMGYSIIVIMQTILDLTLMSMLIEDYRIVYDVMLNLGMVQEITYMLLVIGIMFTLAARGYVLLFLNIISVVYALMVYYTTNIDIQRRTWNNIPIDAYKKYPGDHMLVEAVNQEPIYNGWSRAANNNEYIPDNWVAQPITPIVPRVFANANQQKPPQYQVPLWLGQSPPQPERIESDPEPPRRKPLTSQYALPNKVVPIPPPPMPPQMPTKIYVKPEKPQGKKGPPIPFPDYSPSDSPTDLRSVIKPHSSYY